MRERELNQSLWARARDDTIRAVRTGRFWLAEVVAVVGVSIIVAFLTPSDTGAVGRLLIQTGVFFGAAIEVVGLTFATSLVLAPYRQRDEALAALSLVRENAGSPP